MLTRRGFLAGTAASTALLACRLSSRGPLIKTPVPAVTHGVQVGDVGDRRARSCGRAATSRRAWSSSGTRPRRSRTPRRVAGPVVGPTRDHGGDRRARRVCPPRRRSRIACGSSARPSAARSAWVDRAVRDAARRQVARRVDRRHVRSGLRPQPRLGRAARLRGDARGAARVLPPLRRPDLRRQSDPPRADSRSTELWQNISNERVARVAQELDDFRARFAYNLEDEHVRALAAEVPDHRAVGRSRDAQQLVARPDARRRSLHDRARCLDARRASRCAAMLRVDADRAAGPIQRVDPLRPAARRRRRSTAARFARRTTRTPARPARCSARAQAALARRRARALDARAGRSSRAISRSRSSSAMAPAMRGSEGFANGAGPPLGREKRARAACSPASKRAACATSCGSPPTCTTPPRITSIRRARRHRVRTVLGVRRRPDPRRHVRPERARSDVRSRGRFQWAPPPGTGNLAPWDGLQIVRHDRRQPRRAARLTRRDRRPRAIRHRSTRRPLTMA